MKVFKLKFSAELAPEETINMIRHKAVPLSGATQRFSIKFPPNLRKTAIIRDNRGRGRKICSGQCVAITERIGTVETPF